MQSLEEEVEAFLSSRVENTLGDGDSSCPSRSITSQILKILSTFNDQNDDAISPIEERLKISPLSCIPIHVVQLAKYRRWNSVLTIANALLMHPSSALSTLFEQIFNHTGPRLEDPLLLDTDQNRQDTCMLIFYKILALQKLKQYGDLKEFLQTFYHCVNPGDNNSPEYYKWTEFPSWVPLSLQLYAFCLLHYSSDVNERKRKSPQQNQTNITHISDVDLHRQLLQLKNNFCVYQEAFSKTFHSQLIRTHWLWILSNGFIRGNDVRQAIKCLDDALTFIDDSFECDRPRLEDKSTMLSWLACRVELLSCQGRILIEYGAIDSAESLFKQAKENYDCMIHLMSLINQHQRHAHATDESQISASHSEDKKTFLIVERASYRVTFDNALLHFGRGRYEPAQDEFLHALNIQATMHAHLINESPLVPYFWTDNNPNEYDVDIFLLSNRLWYTHQSILDDVSECCINLSLCSLYSGRMREAIHTLESIMRQYPKTFMTDCSIFNLCTLYELGYDPMYSEKKKIILWTVANKVQLDDLIDKDTFRLM